MNNKEDQPEYFVLMMYKEECPQNDEFIIVHVVSVPSTEWGNTHEEIYISDNRIEVECHTFENHSALEYIQRKLRQQYPSDDYMITSDGFVILKKHDDNKILRNLMDQRHFI